MRPPQTTKKCKKKKKKKTQYISIVLRPPHAPRAAYVRGGHRGRDMGVLGLPVGRSGRPRARSGRRGVLETVFNVKLFHLVIFSRPVTIERWPPKTSRRRVRVFHTTPRWKKFSSEKICGAPSLRYNLSGRSRVGGGAGGAPLAPGGGVPPLALLKYISSLYLILRLLRGLR